MRPVRLELEGFGSYRTATEVDFDGLHLLAVVGANGAGKSTLLDGINFALWGKARAGGIDSIVSNKTAQARARFTFELGGTLYRVSRVRALGKNTGVTFEVGTGKNGTFSWEPVGDGLVRGTDDEVRRVLGMGHETFAATVFLGQGDADRFTADATPKARKEILADILGLDAYGVVAKAASDEAHRLRATCEAMAAQAAEVEDELAGREEAEAALGTARAGLEDCQRELAIAQTALAKAQEEVTSLDACEARAAQLEADIAALQSKREADRQRAERMASSAGAALERLKKEEARAGQKLAEARAASAAAAGLAAKRDEASRQKSSAEELLSRVTEEGTAIASELAAAHSLLAEVGRRLKETDDHLSAVNADSANAVCYTCGQEVSSKRRAELVASLVEEGRAQGLELARVRAEVDEMERSRREKLAEHAAAKELVATYSSELSTFVRDYEQVAARAASVEETEQDCATIGAQALEAEEHLGAAREAVAGTSSPGPGEGALAGRLAEERARLSAGAGTKAALQAARASYERAAQAVQEATRSVGALEARVAHFASLRAKLTGLASKQAALADDLKVQEAVAKAFGRDGVPAMVLNGVVAELDLVVNDVLARLSGGTLSVRVETQREKKTGGTADTLEIVVSDGVTDRPYATFSGGERFKVDLALRVGLAKLLSRRSGTPIRTLAIDEGWGSLDAESVQAMVECLHTLAEDFDCLITISHVPAVAEAFATRLVVEKTPFGSTVRLSV